MSISSLFQFIIGFFIGVIFFTAGIAGGAYFFLTNVDQNPEKHIFAEEKSSPKKEEKKETKSTAKPDESKTTTNQAVEEKKAESSNNEEEKTEKEEELPAGAYFARVTWSTGLSLRAEPSINAQRVGGVGYNSKLIILSTSPDGDWQKVRLINSGQEAWVKAGNVVKVED